ncbi:hypothetical protein ES705_44592 [subsurface metagenome]
MEPNETRLISLKNLELIYSSEPVYLKVKKGLYANVSADETIRSRFAPIDGFLLFLQSKKIGAP